LRRDAARLTLNQQIARHFSEGGRAYLMPSIFKRRQPLRVSIVRKPLGGRYVEALWGVLKPASAEANRPRTSSSGPF
jgi:hypothetical protein